MEITIIGRKYRCLSIKRIRREKNYEYQGFDQGTDRKDQEL